MEERDIFNRPPFPWAAAAVGFLAIAAVVGALFTASLVTLLFGLPAFLVAAALFLTRKRIFHATLRNDEMEVLWPHRVIRYDEIEGIRGAGRSLDLNQPGKPHYEITLILENGVFNIPARLNVDSEDLFQFLMDRIPTARTAQVNPKLQRYYDAMVEKFGDKRVFAWRGRNIHFPGTSRRTSAVGVALFLSGIVWIAVGLAFGGNQDIGAFLFLGTVFLLVSLSVIIVSQMYRSNYSKSYYRKPAKRPGLVVSPLGLALVMNELEGELTWDELSTVFLQAKSKSYSTTRSGVAPAVFLGLEGAEIFLHDIFDRPLYLIYRQIMRYWRGLEV